jgi:hypothetical protein
MVRPFPKSGFSPRVAAGPALTVLGIVRRRYAKTGLLSFADAAHYHYTGSDRCGLVLGSASLLHSTYISSPDKLDGRLASRRPSLSHANARRPLIQPSLNCHETLVQRRPPR